jgi:[ribosomal protein S5]-alanine N-acetyltransferase
MLSSRRVVLRPVQTSDIDTLHQHWNHRAVRRYLWDDRPLARKTVEAIVTQSEQDFRRAGYGLWLMEYDETPIGCCGLRLDDQQDLVELLYSVDAAYWGQGLATEAARTVVVFAFETLGLEQLVASVDEPNIASIRVLEKVGMRVLDRRLEDQPVCSYTITRADFFAS